MKRYLKKFELERLFCKDLLDNDRELREILPSANCSQSRDEPKQRKFSTKEKLYTRNDLQEHRMNSELAMLNVKHQLELFRLTQFRLKNNIFLLQKEKNNRSIKSGIKKKNNKKDTYSIPYENFDYVNNYNLMEQGKKDQEYELYEDKKAKRFANFQKRKRAETAKKDKKQQFQNERTNRNLQRTSLDCALRKEKIKCDIEMKEAFILMKRRDLEAKRLNGVYKSLKKENKRKDNIKNLKKKNEENQNAKRQYYTETNEFKQNKYNENQETLKERKTKMISSFDIQRVENIKSLRMILQQNMDNEETKNQIRDEFNGNKAIDKIFENYEEDKKKILKKARNEKKREKEEKAQKVNEKEKEGKGGKEGKEEYLNEKESERTESKNQSAKERSDQKINNNIEEQKNKKENPEDKEKEEQKEILKELEIRQEVKEFKNNKYQNFLKMLEEEKIKEKKRDRQLAMIRDKDEKLKLEEKFGKERTIVSNMLREEYGRIEEYAAIYEQQLRDKYSNQEEENNNAQN